MTAAAGERASVLLAGANHRSTLAAAHSMSRHAVPFAVVGPPRRSMVGCSRYVRSSVVDAAPNPVLEQEKYVEFLIDVVRRRGIQLVVPLTDSTLSACELHREAIEEHARLAAAPSHAVRNVLDKRENLELARTLGIPCPDGFELTELDQVPALVAEFGFLLVLKRASKLRGGADPAPDFTWLVVKDEAQLRRHLEPFSSAGDIRSLSDSRRGPCRTSAASALREPLSRRINTRASGASGARACFER